MVSKLLSRLKYIFQGIVLFGIRGGMIIGTAGLALGSIGGFFLGEGDPAGILALGLGLAVIFTPFGLLIGAITGAVVGLLKGDFLFVYLRRLDDFVLALVIIGSNDSITLWLWRIGTTIGAVTGFILGTFLGMSQSQQELGMILSSMIGTVICTIVGLAVAVRIGKKRLPTHTEY